MTRSRKHLWMSLLQERKNEGVAKASKCENEKTFMYPLKKGSFKLERYNLELQKFRHSTHLLLHLPYRVPQALNNSLNCYSTSNHVFKNWRNLYPLPSRPVSLLKNWHHSTYFSTECLFFLKKRPKLSNISRILVSCFIFATSFM